MEDLAFQTFFILFAKGIVKVFPSFLIYIIFENGILSICIFYFFVKGLKEYFSFCKRNGGNFSFDKLLQFHFRREEQSVCLIKSKDITFLKEEHFKLLCLQSLFRFSHKLFAHSISPHLWYLLRYPSHPRQVSDAAKVESASQPSLLWSILSLCWLTFIINLN